MAFDPQHAVPVVGLHQVYRGVEPPLKSAAELGAERAAAECGTGERFLAGMGHGFVNLGRGLHQVALEVADDAGLNGAKRARQDYQKTIDDARATDEALLSTTAGRVGDVAGTVAAMLVPGANTIAGATLVGGALGALEPTATGESRLGNTAAGAVGGVAGKVVGDAAGKGLQYAARRVAKAARDLRGDRPSASGDLSPPPRPPPDPLGSASAPPPIAPPPAGRIVSGGGNRVPDLTDEERRLAAAAAGIRPEEVPPETAEVAHLAHTDPEAAQRIHAEHRENPDAFAAAVKERNWGNGERDVAAVGTASGVRPLNGVGRAGDVTFLYQKVGPNREHLKFGITSTPKKRYTKAKLAGGELKILAQGSRPSMLGLERKLHETLPIGPEEGQKFYINKQTKKGLNPPPYDVDTKSLD